MDEDNKERMENCKEGLLTITHRYWYYLPLLEEVNNRYLLWLTIFLLFCKKGRSEEKEKENMTWEGKKI